MFLYDCAIIGGGLGGLCLAIQLGKAGKKVVLFEKDKYPFHKVCGEYISWESRNFLERLGVPLDQMQLPVINRLQVSACDGQTLQHQLAMPGFGISRYTLDNQLAAIARQNGVELMEGTRISEVNFEKMGNEQVFTLKSPKAVFRAHLVAGAYGKRSNLDVKLERAFIQKPQPASRNYVGVKYHVAADIDPALIQLHNFKDGYCGISRIEDGHSCLCYLTTAQNLKDNGNSIPQMEKNVLMRNPHLQKYFSEAEFLYENPLAISQICFEPKSTVENHILMLGDAAGLITPLCGNGMSMAMHASFLLFPLMLLHLHDPAGFNLATLENSYTAIWRKNFATRLKAGRMLQYLFGGEITTNVAISVLRTMPAVVNRLVSLTHGKPF